MQVQRRAHKGRQDLQTWWVLKVLERIIRVELQSNLSKLEQNQIWQLVRENFIQL